MKKTKKLLERGGASNYCEDRDLFKMEGSDFGVLVVSRG